MKKETPEELLERYLSFQCSIEEEQQVHRWLDSIGRTDNEWTKAGEPGRQFILRSLYREIQRSCARNRNRRPLSLLRWAAAAAGIFLASWGVFYAAKKKETATVVLPDKADRLPGTNRAVLTLSDGSAIALDSQAGPLTQQGSVHIRREAGTLSYKGGGTELLYNTLTTPKGGQYALVLADGTKVWLNAASSIRFPVSFPGKHRQVDLTGEAYFEVAPDAAKPFVVRAGDLQVRVLGTHFNINAYEDEEALQTTLLEGSVQLSSPGNRILLFPGEQAELASGVLRKSPKLDAAGAIAWKNGFFSFEDQSTLPAVLRQLSRWYDLDIVYEGPVPALQFGGKISRLQRVSEVLRVLTLSHVQCRLEGRRLVVSSP